MPERLPTSIFLKKATAHVGRSLVHWMRGCLVACTWFVWLPWTMRFVWWGLFWFADVGWVKDPTIYSMDAFAPNNTKIPVVNASSIDYGSMVISEMVKGPAIFRSTSWMLRLLLSGNSSAFLADFTPESHLPNETLFTSPVTLSERGTLLSGISFLNSLTSSHLVNRVLIDVLEGQVITLSLIALIILILLIREWVVQQQPMANLVNDQEEVRQEVQRNAPNGRERPEQAQLAQNSRQNNIDQDEFVERFLEAHIEDHSTDQGWDVKAIREIIVKACLLGTHVQNYRDSPREVQSSDDQVQEAAQLVEEAHRCLLALGYAYARAVKDEDLETIREVRRSVREIRRLISLFPEKAAGEIDKVTQEIKRSMRNTLPAIKAKSAGKESQEADQHSEEEYDEIPAFEAEEPNVDNESNSSFTSNHENRPAMPPRDESFVATEIQRSLQEGSMQDRNHVESPSIAPNANRQPSIESVRFGPSANVATDQSDDPVSRSNDSATKADSPKSSLAERSDSAPTAAEGQTSATSDGLLTTADDQVRQEDETQLDRRNSHDVGANDLVQTTSDDQVEKATPDPNEQNRRTTFTSNIANWLWGDLDVDIDNEDDALDREEIVNADGVVPDPQHPINHNLDEEEDFNDLDRHEAENEENQGALENGEPAPAQGLLNDADAVEEAEDLEGVMELIGMQGAISNLFTNAMFASVFVSCTIVIAVWVPFLLGKVAVIMFLHPLAMAEAPFKFIIYATNVTYDISLLLLASAFQWLVLKPTSLLVDNWRNLLPQWVSKATVSAYLKSTSNEAMDKSSTRLLNTLRAILEGTDTAYSTLTFDSYAAIRSLQYYSIQALNNLASIISDVVDWKRRSSWESVINVELITSYAQRIIAVCASSSMDSFKLLYQLPSWVMSSNITVTYTSPELPSQDFHGAPSWTALDRGLATTIGYIFIAVVGAIYFTRLAPLAKSRHNKKIETVILEILQQAGGIAKVVLIISIEMLVFPLYCGLLLDIAMLPLFEGANLQGRVEFSRRSPWTSLFVHWFVGTAYMFHFALFVAMCRRIFRKGVLYFIRDPDDPTFHPVRDVLERSVVSQLRKIASSALIYGGLVIICVGSIIWSLSYTTRGFVPVRWAPYSGANAFPFDLVLYIFVRPLAMKHLALSDWLQDFYRWFFRRCAKALRLSNFLFGESDESDQEVSHLHTSDSEHENSQRDSNPAKRLRVPANDQVRVSRGNRAFVEVDREGRRVDGLPESTTRDGRRAKSSDFTVVVIPPYFYLRLTVFVLCLWLLTAGIGFTLTVLPLLIGRAVLFGCIKSLATKNDVYAFAIGIFVVCGATLSVNKVKESWNDGVIPSHGKNTFKEYLQGFDMTVVKEVYSLLRHSVSTYVPRIARCIYTYIVLWIVIAFSFSLLLHFYILGPISMIWYSDGGPHTIHATESLVIGIQLVRVMMSLLNWDPDSRGSRALHAIFEEGYSNPKPALANRYLFLPTLVMSAIALWGPVCAAWIFNRVFYAAEDEKRRILVQVTSYPVTLTLVLAFWAVHLLMRATSRWRMRIRDEVFLIGERLHNYGEKKPPSNAPHSSARVVQ